MLLSIIVYIYTVLAFNFFRKFYIKEEEGEVDYKCHDMLTVSCIVIFNSYLSLTKANTMQMHLPTMFLLFPENQKSIP